ncbi:uncharacterized protein PAC_05066 [Phialocephala subalpina]|uniref:2EXR domain-containing protein n=1 Tax=Phialocephala subalpina TaxID=576137 RepID=A0A1L7WQZ0_9HELO|nr:uncharacterized protein PAC_05066 [Phialocephala subalpina]
MLIFGDALSSLKCLRSLSRKQQFAIIPSAGPNIEARKACGTEEPPTEFGTIIQARRNRHGQLSHLVYLMLWRRPFSASILSETAARTAAQFPAICISPFNFQLQIILDLDFHHSTIENERSKLPIDELQTINRATNHGKTQQSKANLHFAEGQHGHAHWRSLSTRELPNPSHPRSSADNDGTFYYQKSTPSDSTSDSGHVPKAARKAAQKLPVAPVAKPHKYKTRVAPLKNFTLFPELLVELRLDIYDHMMPGPRIVEVLFKEDGEKYYTDVETTPSRAGIAKKLRDVNPIESQVIIKSRLQRSDPLPHDTPTDFPHFTNLPKELRLQIYDELMTGPRMIEVLWTEKGDRYFSNSPAPRLLHIWSESREYGLKRYRLLIVDNRCGTITPSITYNIQRPFGTYFDFKTDGLYFSLGNSNRALRYLARIDDFLSNLEPLDAASRLRNLIVHAQVMYARGIPIPSIFAEPTSLQHLGIAVNDVNLSFVNRHGKNSARQSPMIRTMSKSLRNSEVRRWDWSQAKVVTRWHWSGPFQWWNAPHHTVIVDGIKLDMKAQGLDKALVDRLVLRLVDIARDESRK